MGVYNWFQKSGMSPQEFEELYLRQTDSEIGVLFGVTDVAVSQQRKKLGIATIKSHARRGSSVGNLTPASLREAYAEMGDARIAEMHGVSKSVISKLRKCWDIPSISKSARCTETDPFSPEQKEVIIGKMLGDGHLLDRGVLRIEHSLSQRMYVEHLNAILKPFSKEVVDFSRVVKSTGSTAWLTVFQTRQHVWLREMRRVFYPDGIRIFPSSILEDLTPRSFAYWYFDDGHLADNLSSIALGDCSWKDAQMVVEKVSARFGLDCYLKPQSTDSCKILGFRASTREGFHALVAEFAEGTGMEYKIPRLKWKS